MKKLKLKPPYLIFLGDEKNTVFAKTGMGLVKWRPELVAGQLRFSECKVDLGVPDYNIKEAVKKGIKSLVIGVAPIGGILPDAWWKILVEAAESGMDIINGLHIKLRDNPEVLQASLRSGSKLIDIRIPLDIIPVGTGIKRTGKRLLTVGTDCASGKKYTALALEIAMRKKGVKTTFRATGQTGIMIAGEGIPIDAVVADFISGAAELISPNNEANHWDIIEGQGSLFHPAYSGVSMGLLHGSQPDAIVVCHTAMRTNILGWEHFTIRKIQEVIDLHLTAGKLTNPDICCVGISINTSGLEPSKRKQYLKEIAAETGLPCVDPLIDGCDSIVEYIRSLF